MNDKTDNEETAEALRSAADSIEQARAEIEYGSLHGPTHEIERFIDRLDEQLAQLDETFRELAVLSEAERDE